LKTPLVWFMSSRSGIAAPFGKPGWCFSSGSSSESAPSPTSDITVAAT
jgi:hypothetical protein